MTTSSSEIYFVPALPTRATRKPPVRSKASSRGSVTGGIDTDRPQVRVYESALEQAVLYLLLARRDVVDIWDQPAPISYHDVRGRSRQHTFDFRIVLSSGRRVAIAVKPEALVRRQRFRETLRLIRTATPLSYAHDVVLLTERSYKPAAARNAQKLHEFRRFPDPEADAAIAALIHELTAPTTLAEIAVASGIAGRGFRAAFRAIFSGLLRADHGGDIMPASIVASEVDA